MKRTFVFAATLAGAALFASAALAADISQDQAIRAAIKAKLESADLVNGGGPAVTVSGGVVTLSGKVRSVWAREKAGTLAMDVEGVSAVVNDLDITHAESDEKLAEEVARAVRNYPLFTIYDDVDLTVDEGRVTLTGRVTMPYKSEEIERRVSRVTGVQSVATEIQALPTNIGDQRLRAALAYRIYVDPLFYGLGARANPPIHIVVERGRVALTGAVRSEVERRKAEIIARTTFGVFSVDNRLIVAS